MSNPAATDAISEHKRASIGVDGLGELLGGGLPATSRVLLLADTEMKLL